MGSHRKTAQILLCVIGGAVTAGVLAYGLKDLVALSKEGIAAQGVIEDYKYSYDHESENHAYRVRFDGGSKTFHPSDLENVGIANKGRDLVGTTIPMLLLKEDPDTAILVSEENRGFWALTKQEGLSTLFPFSLVLAALWTVLIGGVQGFKERKDGDD